MNLLSLENYNCLTLKVRSASFQGVTFLKCFNRIKYTNTCRRPSGLRLCQCRQDYVQKVLVVGGINWRASGYQNVTKIFTQVIKA